MSEENIENSGEEPLIAASDHFNVQKYGGDGGWEAQFVMDKAINPDGNMGVKVRLLRNLFNNDIFKIGAEIDTAPGLNDSDNINIGGIAETDISSDQNPHSLRLFAGGGTNITNEFNHRGYATGGLAIGYNLPHDQPFNFAGLEFSVTHYPKADSHSPNIDKLESETVFSTGMKISFF